MLADDIGGPIVKDVQWAKKSVSHDILYYVNDMAQRIDEWTDVFTIVKEHKKEVWIEKIVIERGSTRNLIFSKTLLRRWTFWDDILGVFWQKANVVEYNGRAYKPVSVHEQNHWVEGEALFLFKGLSDTWQQEAWKKRSVDHELKKANAMGQFLSIQPPNHFN